MFRDWRICFAEEHRYYHWETNDPNHNQQRCRATCIYGPT